ncbi:hypothetical protein [Arthrobacter sp. MMS24-S77]
MVAFDETSDQPGSASQRGPVFVDASGRRLRRVKLIGLGALALAAGYVVLLLVALVGGPNIAAPYLPLPAASAARDLPSTPSAPAFNAAGPPVADARPAAPAAPAAFQAPAAPASPVPAAPPINSAATKLGAASAPTATPAPGAGRTSPGKSGTAPGQATRPSTPAHP